MDSIYPKRVQLIFPNRNCTDMFQESKDSLIDNKSVFQQTAVKCTSLVGF